MRWYSACGVFRTVDPTCSEWSTLDWQTIPELAISPGQMALWRLPIDGIGGQRQAARFYTRVWLVLGGRTVSRLRFVDQEDQVDLGGAPADWSGSLERLL